MRKLLLFSFIIISFYSCVDKDYDLNKDISTEMELFSDGIGLPIGYTDKLKLDSLIKDVEYLYIDADGKYYLSVQDSFYADVPELDRSKLRIEGQSHTNVLESPEKTESNFSKKFSGKASFEEMMYVYRDTFDVSLSEEMPEELLAFRAINLKNPASITIDISLSNVPDFFMNEYIHISFKSKIPDLIKLNNADNVFDFSGRIRGNESLSESISFNKFEKEIIIQNGIFDYTDMLTTEISIGVPELSNTPSVSDTVNFKNIKLHFVATISDMDAQSIVGKMDFQIGPESTRIDLADFADALGNNSENVFDISRADVLFTTNKNLDGNFLASLGLMPIKSGISSSSENISIEINNRENKFFISNDISNAPSGYEAHSMNIPRMLKNIPEEINAAWSAKTDTNNYFFFDFYNTYHVEGKYNVNIPLSFGDEFRILLKDTIAFDLKGDVLDIFFKTGEIELAGEIESTFPLGINLYLDGVDSLGNKIAGLHYEEKVPSSNFSIKIESNKLELLKKTKQWEVTFDAQVKSGQSGVVISKNDYIQLLNFKLRKKGGIIINDIDELNF